jgi:hypothetical protein
LLKPCHGPDDADPVDDRPRPPVTIVAPLIAGVLLLVVFGVRGHIRRVEVQNRAGQVASGIVGHHVRVHCPGPIRSRMFYEITEGRVRFSAEGVPNPETNLSAGACKGLRRVLDKGAALDLQCLKWVCPKADEQAAMGLAVLTHESVHMRGVTDEGLTECEAQKRVATTARQLGLTEASAQAVAYWQRTDYAEMLPDRYRTCF